MTFVQALLVGAGLYIAVAAVTALVEGRDLWRQHYIKDPNMGDSGVMYLSGPIVVFLAVFKGVAWPVILYAHWKKRGSLDWLTGPLMLGLVLFCSCFSRKRDPYLDK